MSIARTLLLVVPLVGCTEYELKTTQSPAADPALDTDAPVSDVEEIPEEPEPSVDEPASLEGRICDPSGDGWVVGATVSIEVDDDGDGVVDRVVEVTTDVDGHFSVPDLPPGVYTVTVVKGSFTTSFVVDLESGTNTLAEPECLLDDKRIAVLTGSYDKIEDLLDDLGMTYDLIEDDQSKFLKDAALLDEYEMIFLNCGMSDDWWFSPKKVKENLKAWVQAGGSLYVSDWSFYAAEGAFPDAVDYFGADNFPDSAFVGRSGTVQVMVLDPTMQILLGSPTGEVKYDLGGWAVPIGVGAGTTVLVQGNVSVTGGGGQVSEAPLAVSYQDGGRVIFTSFHTEPQMTRDMELMLKEIILSL